MPKPWTPSVMSPISDFMLKHSVGLELFWLFELVSAGFKPKKENTNISPELFKSNIVEYYKSYN